MLSQQTNWRCAVQKGGEQKTLAAGSAGAARLSGRAFGGPVVCILFKTSLRRLFTQPQISSRSGLALPNQQGE